MWTIFGDELSECRCDVSAFDLRRSMCRPSKIDVLTFEGRHIEDRWSLCRPSKADDQCEIMLLHLLKTLTVIIIVVCKLRRGGGGGGGGGLHFSAFITLGAHAHSEGYCSCPVCVCVCVCVCVHS